ncbi:MAG: sulfatase-like hydrolase/transferase [Cyclobacteriaceae bacterium]|nr:sulfatase-like hydrolase/transferase [Cyclobacteriaceae bacterium]
MNTTSLRAIIFILLPLLISTFSCKRQNEKTDGQKPNIVLIMADDLGYETIGAYGSKMYQTPNLDKMAREGMMFSHCYAMPLCTPSRVQLMTGKYNFRNYIGFGLLDPAERTFGHLMQDAGYKTCVVGKWQLLGNKKQQELAGGRIGSWPNEAGFDEYCLWQIDKLGSRYKHPVLSISGEETRKIEGGYGPDVFVEYIENFIESNSDNPFFLYYPMVITHDPFVPTPGHPDYDDEKSHKSNDAKYFGTMVNYMDSIVGRIVRKLEEQNIRDNTLVLFIGDNGTDRDVTSTYLGKPFKGNKGYTNDAGTHVPFIASWPGKIKSASINDNLVDFTDFLPSIMEATRPDIPEEFVTDGVSFYPQLLGKDDKVRDWVFCHYDPNWGKFKASRFVHNKEWKLYEDGRIYNIMEDLQEINPLNEEDLTSEQIQIIDGFRRVLQKMQ